MIQGVKVCPACHGEYGNEHATCPTDGVTLIAIDTGAGERGENLIGQVVGGRYRLERVVGRGGMGTVYACRHVVVGKAFAMKVLRPGIERSEEILQRFIREAQAANAIGTRHICEVIDFGQLDNGAFFVVMELIEGASLTRALREGRLSHDEIRTVFVQMAETLQKAHERGIIHRDLKPDNVLLIQEEGYPIFAKLLDFGIAKIVQAEASNLTETGVILGTPYYMSPEQARGDTVDHRSDIYALGVMMYRAFTGRLPFMADTAMGVLTRHLTEVPEPPSHISDVDPITERVILRCMEKRPIDRFQAMADVAAALRGAAERQPVSRGRPTVDDATGRELRQQLDERLAAPAAASSANGPGIDTWSAGGPPSDARQTTPRFTAVAHGVGYAQPAAGSGPQPSAAVPGPAAAGPSIPPPLPVGPGGPQAAWGSAPAAPPHSLAAGGPSFASPAGPSVQPSPWPPLTPAPGALDGVPRELHVEAFTARGLVSSRVEPAPRQSLGPRVVLWGGALLLMLGLGGVSAFVLLSPTQPPPGSATAPASSSEPEAAGTDDEGDDDATPALDETREGDAGGDTDTAPAASASADTAVASASGTAAPRPPARPVTGPGHRPQPPATAEPTTGPRPEIRSPFD